MIHDKIENIRAYQDDVRLYAALIALKNFVENQKYDETSVASFNLQEGSTCLLRDAKLENHHKFIDIHYVISGKERILVNSSTSGLKRLTDFSEENDCELFALSGTERCVDLRAGDFLVVYPGESHAPKVAINDEITSIKKVVVKL